jgi:hypothetical protein
MFSKRRYVALEQPVALMEIFAGTEVIGSIHADRRGWVAWDAQGVWLGNTSGQRFRSGEAAIVAAEEAYAKRTGKRMAVTGWRVSVA